MKTPASYEDFELLKRLLQRFPLEVALRSEPHELPEQIRVMLDRLCGRDLDEAEENRLFEELVTNEAAMEYLASRLRGDNPSASS